MISVYPGKSEKAMKIKIQSIDRCITVQSIESALKNRFKMATTKTAVKNKLREGI